MTDYNFDRLPGETKFRHLMRVSVARLNKEHSMDWLDIKDMFEFQHSGESLRKYASGWKLLLENEEIEKINEEEITYKETNEILANGSHKSDKLLRMSAEDSKNVDYLLAAHGFDKNEWELVSAKNNIWNVYSAQDGVSTLYSSKVTVKPKSSGFDLDKLVERLSNREPIIVPEQNNSVKRVKLLEISLYDMHFGISTLDDYRNVLEEIIHKIRYREWNKIVIPIGQDLLHTDNFKGQTANGTNIGKVDLEKAFDEALVFYETVITEALKHSNNNVECIYVKGNHDESMTYGLFRVLKAIFPQVEFDTGLEQRKAFVWEKIFIGLTHGDKGANRLMENFMSKFGKLIANAEVREIHSGHLHTEITKDKFGLVQRTLATANKTDEWHDDNGFIGANKRFQLFEYSPSTLDAIYYIQ
jgi:predicted phosphodiesterase